MSSRYIDGKEQASMIRKAMREAFPTVKASVRLRRYAGGASIDVSWTDGPTVAQVNSVIGRFESGGFDGMQDLKYSIGRYLEGEPVMFGTDFLFTRREYSEEFQTKYAPRAAAKVGVDPAGLRYSSSGPYLDGPWSHDGQRLRKAFEKYTETIVHDSPTARRVGTAAEVPSYIQRGE